MNPVFATVLAAILLKEHLRAPEIICLGASLLGVLFIAHPSSLFGAMATPANPVHIGIALVGAICSGSAYALVRKMRTTVHPLVIVFYLPLLSVPTSLPFALAEWRWPTAWEWVLLLGVGITTQLAQVSMTRGLQLERTARATTTGYLQVAFAVTCGHSPAPSRSSDRRSCLRGGTLRCSGPTPSNSADFCWSGIVERRCLLLAGAACCRATRGCDPAASSSGKQ
jgi:drug/metabolite transporter (DMT)-like permease